MILQSATMYEILSGPLPWGKECTFSTYILLTDSNRNWTLKQPSNGKYISISKYIHMEVFWHHNKWNYVSTAIFWGADIPNSPWVSFVPKGKFSV